MHAVTDMDATPGDAVDCAWTDHDGTHCAGTGTIRQVTAEHVMVRLDVPLYGGTASFVVFPRQSDVAGLSCRRPA